VKYNSLRIIASATNVLAWVAVVIGVISSIRLGIAATTPLASISFLLGSLLATAIVTLMLLATSKFIYLFLDIQRDLSKIAEVIKEKAKD